MKKRVVSILLTGLAVLSLAACTSNGLEAASATNDNAKEAEAGTEKKEGISVYWVGKTLDVYKRQEQRQVKGVVVCAYDCPGGAGGDCV